MTQYVISDHHFEHDNIRDYANRPFDSIEEMHREMYDRWCNEVSRDDVVLYGGDIAMDSGDAAANLVAGLPGNVLYVKGNHDDSLTASDVPFPMVEHTIVQHDGYRFWYTHRPEDVPETWTEWVLHGHTHDDDPFIDYGKNRVNVCVEAVEYRPVPLPQITKALDSMGNGDVAETIGESPIRHHQWYPE